MDFSADVSDCCVLRLPVIHLATVGSEAGADLNAPGGLLPGQRTRGSGSVGRVSGDALVSLAALPPTPGEGGGTHTLSSHGMFARYPGNIFHFPLETME